MSNTDKITILTAELKKYPTVLDPEQVADILGISRRTVDNLIKSNVLKSFVLDPSKERKQYRVNKADLMAYITNK